MHEGNSPSTNGLDVLSSLILHSQQLSQKPLYMQSVHPEALMIDSVRDVDKNIHIMLVFFTSHSIFNELIRP